VPISPRASRGTGSPRGLIEPRSIRVSAAAGAQIRPARLGELPQGIPLLILRRDVLLSRQTFCQVRCKPGMRRVIARHADDFI
jgi:hypothetical protein